MKKIADGDAWTMPATIDDPAILDEIGGALQARGLASSERGQAARQAQAAARRQTATGHE
jgi:hypothetical protein